MDNTSQTNRERRRKAQASRRAARGNAVSDCSMSAYQDVDHHHAYQMPEKLRQQPRRQPFEGNLLSSLSQALSDIDKHHNDYFPRQGDGDVSNRHGYDSETISFSSPNANYDSSFHPEKKAKYSELLPPPSQFSSYLKFNRLSLNCLQIFIACYLIVLICCFPMISFANVGNLPTDDDALKGSKHHIKRGASFEHIRGRKQFIKASRAVTDRLGTLKERAIKWEEGKLKVKRRAVEWQETEMEVIDSIAGGTVGSKGGEDAKRAIMLLDEAIKDFEGLRSDMEKEDRKRRHDAVVGGHDHWKDSVEAWDTEFVQYQYGNNAADATSTAHKGKTPGVMILGMHRSGTSLLSGLLVKGFGYETGGPLIGANFDNEKGFYERIDVVVQNDEFMAAQDAGWSWNVFDYDPEKALQHKQQGKVTFKEGEKALKFLNNHAKTLPYLQKDPRMCIVLPTWLKLLDDKPAIVFTYRHPLEVAMSLKHREKDFTIEHGLRLWIVYNMRAIQNSIGLCRVFSTNKAILKDPMAEVQRVKNELTDKCHVIPPPTHQLSSQVVDEFVDPKLQHNSKERTSEEEKPGIMKDFGNGCLAQQFVSEYERQVNRKAEEEMFLIAMKVFCDLENGKAYANDYQWPDIIHWQRPARIN